MNVELYYEEITEGMALPTLRKHPTTKQLVKWAGVSEDFFEIHYDKDYALSQGLPSVIVQGDLTCAFLSQLLTDWIGEKGTIRKMKTSNRQIVLPNEDLICEGRVVKKYSEGTENFIECEIWARNTKGEKCTVGNVIITLPSKDA